MVYIYVLEKVQVAETAPLLKNIECSVPLPKV